MKRIKFIILIPLAVLFLFMLPLSVLAADSDFVFGDIISPVPVDEFPTDTPLIVHYGGVFSYMTPDGIYRESNLSSFVFDTSYGTVFSLSYVLGSESLLVYDIGDDGLVEDGWVDNSYRVVRFDASLLTFEMDGFEFRFGDPEYDVFYAWFMSNMSPYVPPVESRSFLDDLFLLFDDSIAWLSGSFGGFVYVFWNENGLTFLGVFALICTAISVSFTIFNVVLNFLKFRS